MLVCGCCGRRWGVKVADHVVTEEKVAHVPEALKECHVCGGTSFRSLGNGKASETWVYVPGYFRRLVILRESVACRCGGCVVTAAAPERWSDKTRYAVAPRVVVMAPRPGRGPNESPAAPRADAVCS